jgi:TolA-binding protein
MKRTMAISLVTLFLVAGCGGAKSSTVDDLQRSNEDLKARVKALEDQQLQADKKLIQHEQAMQTMNERLKQMETDFDKIRMSGAH